MHDPCWLSRFHSDERQAPSYRVGRVFLAGDAAHCHSPAGGQGMNTGPQDAANLGWKLAAAVRGWGDEALLNSYHTERHPMGRQVLRSSGLLVRLALIRLRWARLARNTIVPALLRIPAIADRLAQTISAIGVRYPALVGSRAKELELPPQVHPALPSHPDREGEDLVLVRPDGYVGWIGTAAELPAWASGYFRGAPLVGAAERPVSGLSEGEVEWPGG